MHRSLDFRHDGCIPRADSEDGDPPAGVEPVEGEVVLAALRDGCESGRRAAPLPKDPCASDETRAEQPLHCGLFQDIPRSIWTVFLAGWAVFFLLMWMFFAVGPDSTFMVTVVLLFGLMAFGLPFVMARLSNRGPAPTNGVIQTHTGPLSVAAAGAQIALIPIAVVIGLLGFILFAKP
jgi:hypothetical protein